MNQLNEPGPDLILLDWMFPGGSGIQFIKHLKRESMTRDIPVVMLTARGEEEDLVRGLETGADDYITKPFSPKELVARIKAVMRRISPLAVEEVIEMQGLSLDPTSHRVMAGEEPLEMGPTEFKLLHFFMTHPERIQFIKHLKRESMTRDIPVVMLTARGEEEDRVRGLETGADDYITKPFSPKELVARIKAVMRRISPMAVEEVIEMQGLSLDPTSHRVMAGEEPLEMGPTEFKLLHFFMTHPERVYSREQLLNHVWGTNVYVEDRTVDVHIRRLRKALEPGGHDRMVQTVRGTGYRFSTRF